MTAADLSALVRTEGPVLARVDGGTLVVTLNRPDAANALDLAMMDALDRLWADAAAAPALRCIVISGAGRAFCAGADTSMLGAPRERVGDDAAAELRFVPGHRVDVPVIVLVNGVCAGGGLHFVADADICVASETARFLDPHVSVGQVSALEPLLLRFRMRPDVLMRMVLLGRDEVLDAEAAQAAGLVSEVVGAERLAHRGEELAASVRRGSPEAVRLSRRVLRRFEERLLATDLDLGWELIRRHRTHPDALEGPQAFAAKRPAVWQDPS
jgi:enoyl-CoA hydratase/carnithine racemase